MANARFQAPQFNARAPRAVPTEVVPTPAANKPEWHDRAANAHGDEAQAMRVSTKDVKRNIAILSAWLGNPAHNRRLTRDDRIEMRIRLDAYRTELRRRGDKAKAAHQAQSKPRAPRVNDQSPNRSVQLH